MKTSLLKIIMLTFIEFMKLLKGVHFKHDKGHGFFKKRILFFLKGMVLFVFENWVIVSFNLFFKL